MKVVLTRKLDSWGYQISLTIGKEYEVLGIEADDYRILDDPDPRGGPFLYDHACFRIVDAEEPACWICHYGEDGEKYCYPAEWSAVGFFEDYFDGVRANQEQFWQDLERYYPETFAKQRPVLGP